MSLSVMEQKLLNKKIKEFNEEIDKGATIITKAFTKYYNDKAVAYGYKPGFKGDVTDDIRKYLERRISVSTFYSMGDYTVVENLTKKSCTEEYKMFVPEVIRQALLEEAVSEFFVKFKELGEIAEGLE